MGILGNLLGLPQDEDGMGSDFGMKLMLAGQVLQAMDQGQVANIAPAVAAMQDRRRKIADQMQQRKWLQNQAAGMADKNPRLAQMLQDAPPEVGASLISEYYKTLLTPPDLKTFEVNGNVYRGNPNDPNAQPELWIQGPGPKPDRVEIGGGYYEIGPDNVMKTLIPPQPKTPDGEYGAYLSDQKRLEDQGLPTQSFAEWKTSMQKPEPRYRAATVEEKRQLGVAPETPLAIEEGTGKPLVVSGNGVTVNMGSEIGTIPPGYQAVKGEDGRYRLEVIPGGPAEAEQAAQAQKVQGNQEQKQQTVDLVTQEIDRSIAILDGDTWYNPATGFGATAAAKIGGTNAANLKGLTQTIGSVITLDGIQKMRQNSPTGAALGAVSDADLALLRSALGSVELSQGEDQLRYNLNRLWNLYQDTIHGPNGGPPRRELRAPEQQGQASTQSSPQQATGGFDATADDIPEGRQAEGEDGRTYWKRNGKLWVLDGGTWKEAQ